MLSGKCAYIAKIIAALSIAAAAMLLLATSSPMPRVAVQYGAVFSFSNQSNASTSNQSTTTAYSQPEGSNSTASNLYNALGAKVHNDLSKKSSFWHGNAIEVTEVNYSTASVATLPGTFGALFSGEQSVYAENVAIAYTNSKLNASDASIYAANITQYTNISYVDIYSAASGAGAVSYAPSIPGKIGVPIFLDRNSTLSGITVRASGSANSIITRISLVIQPSVPGLGSPAYALFSINSTLQDSNVTSAEYNFSVPDSWVMENNISPDQVTLYKLTGGSWTPLPTSLIGNSSGMYYYSAASNSLSTYVVSFSTGAAAGDASPEKVVLPAGYKLYLCAAGANYTLSTSTSPFSWTQDSAAPTGAPEEGGVNASIGHQSTNKCIARTAGAAAPGLAVAGIGLNETHYSLYSNNASSAYSAALSYNVLENGSFVVIMAAAGYYNLTGVTVPSGCAKQQFINNSDTFESAYVAACQDQPAGTYSVSTASSGPGSTALAAYVFSPYSVVLNDSPSSGEIYTDGSYQLSGNSIMAIGTSAINAIAPSGYTFIMWQVSNSLNATVANVLSQNTSIAVYGNVVVTAVYNSTSSGVSLAISQNQISYGQSVNITSTCTPSTDLCEVLVNSVLEASGAGTASYEFPVSAIGSYTVNAINANTGAEETQQLNVTKAEPRLVLNVDGALITGSKAAVVKVPLLRPHQRYNINVTMSSKLLSGNSGNYSYYIQLSNGSFLVPYTTKDANAIKLRFNYKVPRNISANVVFDFSGDKNYTAVDPSGVTVPSNILYYVNITLTNSQTTPTPSPFQQMLAVNSISYNSYEAANLDNVEFFYSNGTIIPSWLESGTLQSSQVINSSNNANLLYSSVNTIYWLNISTGIPASSSINIYMGFANTLTSLFNNVDTGEAPQLSSTYAQYDDGSSVFPIYFNGDTPLSDFSVVSGAAINQNTGVAYGAITINAINVSSKIANVNSQWAYTTKSVPAQAVIAEADFEVTKSANTGEIGIGDSSTAGSNENGVSNLRTGSYLYTPLSDAAGTTSVGAKAGAYALSTWYWASLTYPGTSSSSFSVLTDTVPEYQSAATPTSFAKNPLSSSTTFYLAPPSQHSGTGQSIIMFNFGRLRFYPPNGVMPSATFSGVIAVSSINTSFIETGLPAGTQWNATYDGIKGTSTTNTITISTSSGNYPFSVQLVHLSGNVYVPSPSSGTLAAGNTIKITFTEHTCTAPGGPGTLPSGILFYVPINVCNFQAANTPSPFQQMLAVNSISYNSYEAGSLDNVEFFYPNGTIIPSWLEGNTANQLQTSNLNLDTNTTYWLYIKNSITTIGNVPVYMGFAATSTNLLNGNTVGEAPQLSPTYAQYDNGNTIFTFYDNFSGNTIKTKWTTAAAAGSSVTVDNGITLSTTSSDTGVAIFSPLINYPAVSDALMLSYSVNGGGPQSGIFEGLSQSLTSYNPKAPSESYDSWLSGTSADLSVVGSTGFTTVAAGNFPALPAVLGISWNSTGNEQGSFGSNTVIGTDSTYSVANYYTGLMSDAGTYGATGSYQWFMTRAYPPDGVMPETAFGTVHSILITTFTENGLPSVGETWSVTYNSVTNNALVPSNIYFTANGGSSSFTVANVIFPAYNNDKCTPSPSSGSLASGGTENIVFACPLAVGNPTPQQQSTQIGLTATVGDSGAIGGNAPYTYQWLAEAPGQSSVTASEANSLCSSPQSTTCSFTPSSSASTGNYLFELQAADSSSPKATADSIYATVQVCGAPNTVPSSVPSSVLFYVPIDVCNLQSSNTPSPFQQMLAVNSVSYNSYEAANLDNVEFFYSNGTIIPSWLEGNTANQLQTSNLNLDTNTTYWLYIKNSIAANAIIPVYMGFAATSTNLLNGNTVGEAPQLSPTYAQYDNGNTIFTFYDNFSGNTIKTKWTTAAAAGSSVTVDNGITLSTTSSDTGVAIFSPLINYPAVSDALMLSYSVNGGGPQSGIFEGLSQSLTSYNPKAPSESYDSWLSGTSADLSVVGSTGFTTVAAGNFPALPAVLGISWNSTGNEQGSFGSNTVIGTDSTYSVANYYTGLMSDAGTYGATGSYQWFMTRAYPPHGVMPYITFGSVQSVSVGTCTISLSPNAISFGTLNPSTDTNTNVVVTDTNNGNRNSYMWVYGGNWLLGSNFGFGVSNTLWDASSQTAYLGTALSTTPANTLELVPASSSNSIYFGVGVPRGQTPNTYNQIITIENVC
jgi:PGF-pre-PGF domain-containing protein